MHRRFAVALAAGLLLPAATQAQKAPPPGFPDGPGKEVLVGKCFQCHGPGMWMDQRQDARAWESTLYRMVGRGALWTQEDIRQMAGYLGANYGVAASGLAGSEPQPTPRKTP